MRVGAGACVVFQLSPPPSLSGTLCRVEGVADPLAHMTDAQRDREARRQAALGHYRAGLEQGLGRVAAAEAAAAIHGVNRATIYRWMARAAAPVACEPPRPGAPERAWGMPGAEETWRYYRADYLRPEQPASRACYRRVQALAGVNGWRLPSEKSFLRRLRREVSPAAVVQAREGNLGLLSTFPRQERSVSDLAPLEWVCGDGRRHDLFVLPPAGAAGTKPVRPVVWFWQDVYSRRILAWRAGLVESADMVRLAIVDLCTRHGVPQHVLIDNTRAAAAMWLSGGSANRQRWRSSGESVPGILNLLGIQVHHTGVEHSLGGRGVGRGWAKPVERSFRDLAESIDRHPRAAGAYTGRSTLHKPENYQSGSLPWREFIALVEECVVAHNAQPGRRTETAAGESFDDAWRNAIGGVAVRHLTDSQRALLLLACETTKVRRDGTLGLAVGRGASVPRNRYHHESLLRYVGQQLVARFDPEDLHAGVHVYDLAGRWLCRADCVMPVGFASATAAKAHSRAQKQRRRAVRTELAAQGDMEALLARRTVRLGAVPTPAVEDGGGKIIQLIPSLIGHPPSADTDTAADPQAALRARLNRGRQKLQNAEEAYR